MFPDVEPALRRWHAAGKKVQTHHSTNDSPAFSPCRGCCVGSRHTSTRVGAGRLSVSFSVVVVTEICDRYSVDFSILQQGGYSGGLRREAWWPTLLNCLCSLVCRNKREKRSYREIALSLGVEDCAQITFCTDVYEEAVAARDAGEWSSECTAYPRTFADRTMLWLECLILR